MSIFTLICTFRLDYSVFTKGLSKFREDKEQFTASIQTTISIFTICCLGLYLCFSKYINSFTEINTFLTVLMFCEIFVGSSMTIWSLKERFSFNYKAIIPPTILLALINPLVGIIAVNFFSSKGNARIISSVIVQLAFGLFFYINILKNSRKLFVFKQAKYAVLFNIPLIPHYLSTYILAQADRIMIQKMCGYAEAAIYGIAYNAGALMKIVTDAINNSIIPWLYQTLEKKEFKKIEKSVVAVLIFIFAICVVFIAFAPEAIFILGGKEYKEAIYVIPPVAASMFFTFFFSIVSNIEFYYDSNKFTMYISMFGACLNIILNSIFI